MIKLTAYMTDTILPLLQTKLQRPRTGRDLVPRPQLWEILDHCLDKPLALVCAAAGFGKTTLVCSWLEEIAKRSQANDAPLMAWLTLDENDGDLIVFLRYFVAALRTVIGDACPETMALLQSPQQPRPGLLCATLINDLARLPTHVILVLDDYSAVRSVAVDGLLDELARNWPQPLHLILITRVNPGLPLPRLRARGMMTEIRSRHLRFSLAETTAYLERALPAPLDQTTTVALQEHCEGWIAGLKLAALSLRAPTSLPDLRSVVAGGAGFVYEYLVDETLTNLSATLQEFLLKTSIVDPFCPSLCAALLGDEATRQSAEICIHWLVRADLFITSLDSASEWFRFHHLFREMLSQRLNESLSPAQINELHRRAATWFAKHGLVDEALHHALAADDLELAALLMEEGLPAVLNREDRLTLERWLKLLPEDFVQRHPGLLMLKAWSLQFSWQLGAQARVINQIEALLDQVDAGRRRLLTAQMGVLRGQAAFHGNQAQLAVTRLTEVLPHLPDNWVYARGGAMIYLGVSMHACGDSTAAERLLLTQYEQHEDKGNGFALRLQLSLCFNYAADGKWEQARQTAGEMLRQVKTRELATMQSWAHYFWGLAHFAWNELVAAESHFAEILDRRHTAIAIVVRDGMLQLAFLRHLAGKTAEAWKTVEMVAELDMEQMGREDDATRAMRARLFLMQGDVESAARWVDAFIADPPQQPLLWMTNPHLIRARILTGRQAEGDVETVQHLLSGLLAIAERTFNLRFIIETQALRALNLHLAGDESASQRALRQAVSLARMGGMVRPFVDLGPPMKEMLRRAAQQGADVRRLLAAFPESQNVSQTEVAERALQTHPSPSEPLTRRELQVLTLMGEPLSLKEIAHRLGISYATVKRHTINIYGKLNVNTRWDAVAQGQALLPPTRG